jgi:hypothetical protein
MTSSRGGGGATMTTSIGVMPLIGHDDAGAKCHGEYAQRSVTKNVGMHVGNLLFLDRGAQE